MRIMGWNMRGFGWRGRRTQLRDYLRKENIDVICLQETIKQSFTDQELKSIEPGETFHWSWVSASGHSGGLLLGFRDSVFEVGSIDQGKFFISAVVLHRSSKVIFEFIGVYGPADHSRAQEFLEELEDKVSRGQHPVVVGGDFNLIRGAEDKNNSNINCPRIHLFNDCIARLALRELKRSGARFTWSNKQVNPIRSVLDRVFISPEWETHFPMATLSAETRIGSDHTPLILDSGEGLLRRSNHFFFETSWLALPEFKEVLQGIWNRLLISPGRRRDTIDSWHIQSVGLRQYLKGWGGQQREIRKGDKSKYSFANPSS
jgi:exonuclease III